MAVFTLDKGLTFFDPGNRDEKYLKIMVDTLVIGLVQPADGTAPGVFVKHFRFGGYTEYKKHFWGSKVYPPAAAPKATRVQGSKVHVLLPVQPVL